MRDLRAGRGRGGDRWDEAEGASGADGAEELLADAGEVHAAALDQEQGQEDERAGPGLEQLLAAEEGWRGGRGGGCVGGGWRRRVASHLSSAAGRRRGP